MKVLTDTHTIFWAVSRPELLSQKASQALRDADELYVSVINLFEMAVKMRKPDALVSDPFAWWEKYIDKQNLLTLSILPQHVKALAQLGPYHKDPWDRMLLAQCISEGLSLVSKDDQVAAYGVPVIW